MDLFFLNEGWLFFKRTWRAALWLFGLYLLVVGVPGYVALRPLFRALGRGAASPPAPGPLFFVVIIANFILMPAVYWATMRIASAPGAGEEPQALPSLREGLRHWGQAVGLGLAVLVVSMIPLVLVGWLLKLLGPLGSFAQAAYAGVVLTYAEFALFNLVREPGQGVADALAAAVRLIPKAQWLHTVGALVALGLAVQFLTGLLTMAFFSLGGLPLRVPGPAAFSPSLFWWVTLANLPLMAFGWYQLLCAASLWWRFRGLQAVTGTEPAA